MLERVVRRLRQSSQLHEIAVATSTNASDDAIVAEADRLETRCLRGSEGDVLSRYAISATATDADVIVRVTSDCPLIDSGVVDRLVTAFVTASPSVDYCTNTLDRTYPRGLDAEVFSREALDRAAAAATAAHQREHVTPYLYEHPELFRLLSVKGDGDYSHLRWTVDVPEDLALVRAVYDRLGPGDAFGWLDVLALLEREPELSNLNRGVEQKSLR
jgi:spore coat polysaccharide biosynthesis protein SpsF